MDTFRTSSARWLLIVGWVILLLTACSAIDAPVVADPITSIPLGTTFWTAQNTASVFTVAWSPDGKYLALGGAYGTVQVRNASTGAIHFTVHGHTNHVWALAWSPDGTRLASASWDDRAHLGCDYW